MPPEEAALAPWRARLSAILEQGGALEREGLPFPSEQIRTAFDASVREGRVADATTVVKQGEALLARVTRDWTWVRELLRRADELRAVAETIGVDVMHLDTRVGNPRERLRSEPLSAGSLEKAAASASLSLAVLNDAVPKFCLQEAQQLGLSIREARNRGEDVGEATGSFSRLLQAVQDQNLPTAAQRLVETRRIVTRIPRAPAVPPAASGEEEEILMEARNLARRLQRIKGKAQSAQSAARLMAQVRAAISEERRYGTPEEEIEALWAEVDRLTKEKRRASAGPPLSPESGSPEEPALEPAPELSELDEALPEHATLAREEGSGASSALEEPEERAFRQSLYVPYVPPDFSGPDPDQGPGGPLAGRPRARSRPRP